MELTNKEKVVALLNSFNTGDTTPISHINPNKYIQHNLAVGDGLAGFGALMQNAPEGGFKADVIRAFQDGDYVFTHTEYDFFGPKVGIDLYRFENGLIVEHWDNLIEKADKPNPSGHTQLDGETEIKDKEKTEDSKATAKGFISTVLVDGQFDRIGNYIDGNNYIQHHPDIGDGVTGLKSALAHMAENGLHMEYDTVHAVHGEGNFALVMSEGKFAGKPFAYYDLLRIAAGKVAEHWGVMAAIPPRSEWKNTNGKF